LAAGLGSSLSSAETPHFVDLTPQFWTAYTAAEGASDRANLLIDRYFEPNAVVYSAAEIKITREKVATWLKTFDPMAGDVRRLCAAFPSEFAAHEKRFRRTFPDFDLANAPVFFLPSLYTFDGHPAPYLGKTVLFLGVDGIVRYHGANADLAVLLDHESFHLYQAQSKLAVFSDDAPPLYSGVWTEGTATYVSQALNPTASHLHVLLDDQPLAAAKPELVKRMAAMMLDRLDSRSESDAKMFFSAGWVGDIPARGGYLLGLLVAQHAANRMSLRRMAGLRADEMREVVSTGLKVLAA